MENAPRIEAAVKPNDVWFFWFLIALSIFVYVLAICWHDWYLALGGLLFDGLAIALLFISAWERTYYGSW